MVGYAEVQISYLIVIVLIIMLVVLQSPQEKIIAVIIACVPFYALVGPAVDNFIWGFSSKNSFETGEFEGMVDSPEKLADTTKDEPQKLKQQIKPAKTSLFQELNQPVKKVKKPNEESANDYLYKQTLLKNRNVMKGEKRQVVTTTLEVSNMKKAPWWGDEDEERDTPEFNGNLLPETLTE